MLRLASALPAAFALLSACTSTEPTASAPTATAEPAAAAPAPAPAPAAIPLAKDEHLLLKPGYAGQLRINMNEAELLTLLPSSSLTKTTRRLEGIEYPAYEYRPDDAPAGTPPLLLELVGAIEDGGNRLWRVQVQDARYRTAEGLGVGSTYGEVRRAYGVQTIEQAEGNVAAVSERVGMTWLLDRRSLPLGRVLRKDDIPAGTRITGIILYQ
ncbi:hypothetical protein LJ737_07135 [Hymenobacter sp. 15J16-1T3B]|uniref:hypothetical protein n=1 Tax=Hymenobacter sp. 15J16-1T3B TaxID=2886941 RepID=UPI001D0F70A1|nr:hypothetical protein [Hymenobacter sp. 15J16-1T3B]MCC3157005.1 hypothetical protein [Hymenobacter sp. 15J16-1T3B]